MIEFGQLKIFTAEEVAQRLGTTPARIRSLIKKGQLIARRVGKTHFITEKKLEEFLECGAEPQLSPPGVPAEDMSHDISRIDAILGKNEGSARRE
jgi:excisionase family DNA binding protein